MKKLIIAVALVPFALTLSACKEGHKKNPIRAATEAAKDKDLQKTFQTECQGEAGTAIATGLGSGLQTAVKSSRTQYTFAGNNMTITTVYYIQAQCAQEAWVFYERGDFKIDDKNKSNDGGKHIDFDLRNLKLTVRDQAGATAANAISLCNKKDWSANSKEQDVTKSSKDTTCYGAEVPRKIQNIYRLDGNTLYLGTYKAVEQRPATLNWGIKLTAN